MFHRGAEYDTANDNIVRVSARQLRNKLRDYFDTEGSEERLLLEIPKGAYVPQFRLRFAAEPVTPEPVVVAAPSRVADQPGSEPVPIADPASAGRDRALVWQIATAVCALGMVLLAVRLYTLPTQAGHPITPRQPLLTDIVVTAGQRTLIVLADSGLVLLHQITGKSVTPQDYAEHRYPPDLLRDFQVKDLRRFLPFVSVQQLTSLADVGLTLRVLRLRADAAERIQVAHSW